MATIKLTEKQLRNIIKEELDPELEVRRAKNIANETRRYLTGVSSYIDGQRAELAAAVVGNDAWNDALDTLATAEDAINAARHALFDMG